MPRIRLTIAVILTLFWGFPAFSQTDSVSIDSVSAILEEPANSENDSTVFLPAVKPGPVQVRHFPKKQLDSLRAADEFWYANAVPPKKKAPAIQKPTEGKSWLQQRWFYRLLWLVVLGGFFGAVVWYLRASDLFLFRKRPRSILDTGQPENDPENLFALNYTEEIGKAEAVQNYRLAIRLQYLQTLKALAERRLIDYHAGTTNHVYALALADGPYNLDFLRLTRNFEYTWYGQFEPSSELYALIRENFLFFQNSLTR